MVISVATHLTQDSYHLIRHTHTILELRSVEYLLPEPVLLLRTFNPHKRVFSHLCFHLSFTSLVLRCIQDRFGRRRQFSTALLCCAGWRMLAAHGCGPGSSPRPQSPRSYYLRLSLGSFFFVCEKPAEKLYSWLNLSRCLPMRFELVLFGEGPRPRDSRYGGSAMLDTDHHRSFCTEEDMTATTMMTMIKIRMMGYQIIKSSQAILIHTCDAGSQQFGLTRLPGLVVGEGSEVRTHRFLCL